jgi:phosphonate transport system substrate-binding protein
VNLEGDRDYKVVHLGTHDAVARAVQAGQIPAGALSEPIFRNLVERKVIDPAKVVRLDVTADIPNYPIVMQGNLAPQLKQSIRDAFLNMREKDVLKAFRVEGFAAASDKSYDILRETAQILKMDLAKVK